MLFKVNYTYAAPNGALRSGANIQDAPDADTAKTTVRQLLAGKLRYLNVHSALPYETDQQELNLTTQQKKK